MGWSCGTNYSDAQNKEFDDVAKHVQEGMMAQEPTWRHTKFYSCILSNSFTWKTGIFEQYRHSQRSAPPDHGIGANLFSAGRNVYQVN